MDPVNIAGWTITALLIAGALLRWLTVWGHHAAFGIRSARSSARTMPRLVRALLTCWAMVAAAVAVFGSIFLPYPGLWGPAVLVYSVIWDVNASWTVMRAPWVAPVMYGLRDGARIVLLGGALGTLIAYVVSLPH